MRNRINVFVAGIITVLALFSGCSKNDENNVIITVIGENAANLKALEKLKGEYERKNNVTIDYKPHSFEDAFNKSNQDFANKTGLYDIVMQYNFSLSSFVRNEYVYTLDELKQYIAKESREFEKELFVNAWDEVGAFYKNPENLKEGIVKVGYPFGTNTMILVYNKELFNDENSKSTYHLKYNEKLIPPKTWNQYFHIAEFFTEPDKSTYGVCLQGATGGWLYYEWCNFLFGMGGSVMDKDRGWKGDLNTRITINTDKAINATNFHKSLKPFNAGNFITIGAYEQLKIMRNGKVAMSIMWSDLLYELIHLENGGFDEKFGFAPIPGKKSGLAGGTFFINKQSRNYLEALNYIVDVMQKHNQIKLMKYGLCSPLRSAYDNLEVQKIPYIKALKTSLERGVYMFEAGPDADMISHVLTTYLQKIWNDELAVEEGLNKAKEEIEYERKEIYNNLRLAK